ncbi:MAG: dicarboxylate/amino acid:cation symporter [Sphingobium sp.]|uniref:dicarboxylate/amino acid:cation symporter n=2 Tax=Sphingobium TaxID=165695 RepID=UPI000C5831C9|nr:dicarboxylate/amino acid:cation symporter [Sphingobium sp.]MBU0660350.1 dicarboxylate/amino acid:cation symporter [Alphaproteobacteria bacterium]MBA4754111.1 dicarboxylate/amino acid:cation symporter [Sphingobium sp.]MBS89081.1 dicarboxylate/amino acid:cation symporter [Sphingobium sp.]MBU1256901.1 dicarboxylate/amino acid:cation symporter [Alphaproteobacteria bacterium]MBU1463748.1 dicarboxylate/amino acid:cation symporter [Alphaproteobacteria bacterium]
MSLTVRILIALLLGLGLGIALTEWGGAWEGDVVALAQPVGSAWLNGLQMPLIPLIFALLVTGIAQAATTARSSGMAGRAILLFALLLTASAAVAALVGPLMLHLWPVPPGAVGALSGAEGIAQVPDVRPSAQWLLGFIPTNPIRSAAEGQVVAVVLFALIFGFAVTRIAEARRAQLTGLFEALAEALLVVVGWVLWLAPIGVFALALVAGARSGLATAGALLHYIGFIVLICVIVTLLVYPLAVLLGRIGPGRFARAALPAQAIAFSTQSSIASLPAMIQASDGPLAVRETSRSIVLPLAISLFRITSPPANLGVALYVAAMNGVALGPTQLVMGVLVAAIVSLAAVGLPSQITFFTTTGPICLAMGVPVEALPLLLAVETVPDIFRTVGNVTADMAVARIVDQQGEVGE